MLTNPDCDVPDFSKPPWDQAILVTPWHSVRHLWNEHSVSKHCTKTGNQRYEVHAENTSRDGIDCLSMEARLAIAQQKDANTGKLPAAVHMAIGMKAMVLLNIATEADIANGTRGEIVDIILDEREEKSVADEDGTIQLKYPPMMILFKPDKTTKQTFQGMPMGLIPLTPSRSKISVTGRTGKKFKIERSQYVMTPGYAFTNYKSQGQTIEYVLIDIGRPPTRSLSPFSVYVALSRSRGRNTIRLLRPFDANLFQNHPSEALREEMKTYLPGFKLPALGNRSLWCRLRRLQRELTALQGTWKAEGLFHIHLHSTSVVVICSLFIDFSADFPWWNWSPFLWERELIKEVTPHSNLLIGWGLESCSSPFVFASANSSSWYKIWDKTCVHVWSYATQFACPKSAKKKANAY